MMQGKKKTKTDGRNDNGRQKEREGLTEKVTDKTAQKKLIETFDELREEQKDKDYS